MILLAASVALALFEAGVVLAASASLTRRLWAGRDYLAFAYGIGGVGGASFIVFVGYWVHPIVGAVLSVAVLGGSMLYLLISRAWRSISLAVPVVLVVGGVLLLYIAVLCLWSPTAAGMAITTTHLSDLGLPSDNVIPFLFSDRLADGLSTHLLIDDWNGSDRPPLQSGFLLLGRVLVQPLGASAAAAAGAGIVAQSLWMPALFAVLRASGVTRLAGWLTVVFVALSGTAFVNTVYTWPKLLSAALVLSACALLIDAVRKPQFFRVDFVVAVVLSVLGMLAHGAAAFAAPLLIGLGIAAYRNQRRAEVARTTLAAAVAGTLAYLPWLLYQRLADSPGDRLVKWHLAGVVPVDGRSIMQALADSYRALSPGEWLSGRVANAEAIVHVNILEGLGSAFARRSAEFFTTTTALGISLVATIIILVVLLVRGLRRIPLRTADRSLLLVIAVCLACILFWALLMFTPGSTLVHQGSHVWVLLLLAAPFAWTLRRHRAIALALLAVQAVLFGLVYLPEPAAGTLNPLAVVTGVIGVAAMVAALLLSRPIRRRPCR